MKQYFEIVDVKARAIVDAAFVPAVEVEVTLDDGTVGRASAPSGTANSKDVEIAVENVNIEIAEALLAMNALEQTYLDQMLLELDGTPNASRLGGNAILAASMACAKAAAQSSGLTLYNYLGGIHASRIPEILTEGEAVCLSDVPTLSAFMRAAQARLRSGEALIVSAGEGETEDSLIADLAVALNADGLVTARASVYNQLVRIAEELDDAAEDAEFAE